MTTRYSGRLDLSKSKSMPAKVATPRPPKPSFVSLPGGRPARALSQVTRRLDSLLDTHRWIQGSSDTDPDEDFARAVTEPDRAE